VIVLTGATAVEAILGIKGGMTQLRGQWQSWNGRAVMPIFHPSYLLRNPSKASGAPLDLNKTGPRRSPTPPVRALVCF
jgi:DNA polymerase